MTDSTSWVLQKASLAEQFRLIVLDNRGSGRSHVPAGPYTIEQMSKELHQLLEHLGLPKASLVGHSMGGAVIQQFALDYPERVERMVVACSFNRCSAKLLRVLESWRDAIHRQVTTEELARVLLPWLYTEQFFATEGQFELAVKAMEAHPYPMTPQGVEGQLEALRRFDLEKRWPEVAAPTLVLSAAEDLLATPESCQRMAESNSMAHHQVLLGCGHSSMLEAPDSFNSAVTSFLKA